MEQGRITLDGPKRRQWLMGGVHFFLAAALTASQTMGG